MISEFEVAVRDELKRLGVHSPHDVWWQAWLRIDHLRVNHAERPWLNKGFQDLDYMEARVRKCIGLASLFLANDRSLQIHRDGNASFWRSESNDYFFMHIDAGFSALYSTWNRIANIACLFWPKPNGKDIYPPDAVHALRRGLREPYPAEFLELQQYFAGPYKEYLNEPRATSIHKLTSSGEFLFEFLKVHNDPERLEKLQQSKKAAIGALIEQHDKLSRFVPLIFDMIGVAHNLSKSEKEPVLSPDEIDREICHFFREPAPSGAGHSAGEPVSPLFLLRRDIQDLTLPEGVEPISVDGITTVHPDSNVSVPKAPLSGALMMMIGYELMARIYHGSRQISNDSKADAFRKLFGVSTDISNLMNDFRDAAAHGYQLEIERGDGSVTRFSLGDSIVDSNWFTSTTPDPVAYSINIWELRRRFVRDIEKVRVRLMDRSQASLRKNFLKATKYLKSNTLDYAI